MVDTSPVCIDYSREDLQKLMDNSREGTIVYEHLAEIDCDPENFKEFMRDFPKEYALIYHTPLKEIPTMINDPFGQGFVQWRWRIKK